MESSLPLGELKDNSLTMPFFLILRDSPKRLTLGNKHIVVYCQDGGSSFRNSKMTEGSESFF